MKILSAEEIRKADAFTIAHEPIASVDLMERAAGAACQWIMARYPSSRPFMIFCGLGNNGGDGLVIARILKQAGFAVQVYAVRFSDKCSEDYRINAKRLSETGIELSDIITEKDIPEISRAAVVVDAMFGSGLSRPAEGLAAEVILRINASETEVIAVDIPSGLFCEDNAGNKRKHIIRASHTLTFQLPKLSFLFPENNEYVGRWHVIPIGLDMDFIRSLPSKHHYLTEEMLRGILRKRKKFDHKGTFGHALIVSGSMGKMGAAVLCAAACLRSGSGLVTAHIPGCGMRLMQIAIPEAMLRIDREEERISKCSGIGDFDAIGIGPGIGQDERTASMLKLLLQEAESPLVLDADALNILGQNKTWIPFLPPSSILTPHPKEFERIAGKTTDHYQRFCLQKDMAMKHGVYIVLKGANTAIACPDGEVYFNSTGNPGMATAGSGDVLTGIITGLLAQGYDPKQAAILGVYLHGFVGDHLADEIGEEALIAGDLVKGIGNGFRALKGRGDPAQ